MAFQTPITINTALDRIADNHYVLPAIQREFEWGSDQVCRLFDSIMLGYPVGSFLFWDVKAENSKRFVWYEFLRRYHERERRHLQPANVNHHKDLTAVLDGQQRLTSLNIGLRGSYAAKLPRFRVNSPWAYPEKFLYLNLAAPAEPNDFGMEYDFRFFTKEEANAAQDEQHLWFEVSEILGMNEVHDVFEIEHHLHEGNKRVYRTLTRLYQFVHESPVINYFLEGSEDLEHVLNIFIRVNSGGTPLSYSDLLLSVATAQWKSENARDEIHGLVDELNSIGKGFGLSKDQVLKAGLLLSDIQNIGFRVTNFNAQNMAVLESKWESVKTSLRLTMQLLADFGFSQSTLPAHSVVLPVAYHIMNREANETFLRSRAFIEERERIRVFVIRSLVKRGIWSRGLDTVLSNLRFTLRDHGDHDFPLEQIEATMNRLGRSLRVDEEELEDLLDLSFHDRRVFPVLAILYPGMELGREFHIDHIFPRALFGRSELLAAGVPEELVGDYQVRVNQLPNFQLLAAEFHFGKGTLMPAEWLNREFPNEVDRKAYRERHDLGDIPVSLVGFLDFYDARRDRIARRLRHALGAKPDPVQLDITDDGTTRVADDD